jgi:hypothetical protein
MGYFPPRDSHVDAKPQVLEDIILKVCVGVDTNPVRISAVLPLIFRMYVLLNPCR